MKEIKNDIVKKFVYGNYYVYIKDSGDNYNCYLQHEHYGVIMLMYGISKSDISLEDFLKTIDNNIIEYINLYREDYLDNIFTETFDN